MRNPLGAVIHCCDDIIMSLEGEAAEDGKHEVTKEGIANALDAAKTILHCSIHQKRIVVSCDLLDLLWKVQDAISVPHGALFEPSRATLLTIRNL